MITLMHIPGSMADAGDQEGANNLQSDREPETTCEDDVTKAQAFQTTIQQHVFGGFVTLGLALGSQLGLFDELIKNNAPMTAAKLAEETGCKERYLYSKLKFHTNKTFQKVIINIISELLADCSQITSHIYYTTFLLTET